MIVEGKVINAKTKEPMFQANVFLSDSKGVIVDPPVGGATDPDGEYFFQGGKKGDYISASYIGFKTKTRKITADNPTINWELEPTAAAIPEFQVIETKDEPRKTYSTARKTKRNYTPLLIGGVVLVLAVGGFITYRIAKSK